MNKEFYGVNTQITRLESAIAKISDKQATLVNKMAAKPDSYENNDEDLKVFDVSPIKSLFCNMNLDNDGTEYDPPLPRRRSKNSESLDLDAKFDESGIEESKTLDVAKPTILDFKGFNYENCSLIYCISLLQSVLNSPHAYSQNKAFTKHIVDALMQSYEEKLPKIDELARNMDRLSLDVDSLKLTSIPPKHDINESLKAMRISIDECKERTARMRAKKYCFVKACSSSFHDNKDEDLKVIDVSPIKSLFCNMSLDNDGTREGSTLVKIRSNDS